MGKLKLNKEYSMAPTVVTLSPLTKEPAQVRVQPEKVSVTKSEKVALRIFKKIAKGAAHVARDLAYWTADSITEAPMAVQLALFALPLFGDLIQLGAEARMVQRIRAAKVSERTSLFEKRTKMKAAATIADVGKLFYSIATANYPMFVIYKAKAQLDLVDGIFNHLYGVLGHRARGA